MQEVDEFRRKFRNLETQSKIKSNDYEEEIEKLKNKIIKLNSEVKSKNEEISKLILNK